MRSTFLLVLLAASLMVSCGGPKNPLIGVWHAKQQGGFMSLCAEMVFTKSTSRCDSLEEDVTYVINEDKGEVVVDSPSLASEGFRLVYKVVDNNTMYVVVPFVGSKVYYSRFSY